MNEDKCTAVEGRKVEECYYNQIEGQKHQRQKGEPLCSHCWERKELIKSLEP